MKKSINSPADLKVIYELIYPMVGGHCIEASLSYGTELYLGIEQNSTDIWTITTRASDWYIKRDAKILITSNEEYDILEEKTQR